MKAKYVNKIKSINTVIVFSIVLLFGIIFLTFAVKLTQQTIPENYIEVEAKIMRIEETLSPMYVDSGGTPDASDYEHHVFVKYSYYGKNYSDLEYGNYSSSMQEGDTVLLYIDPDNPAEFISDPSGNIMFIIIGIVVILIGAGGLGYLIYKKNRREK